MISFQDSHLKCNSSFNFQYFDLMSSEEVLKTISMLSIVPDFLFFNCYVLSPFYKKKIQIFVK